MINDFCVVSLTSWLPLAIKLFSGVPSKFLDCCGGTNLPLFCQSLYGFVVAQCFATDPGFIVLGELSLSSLLQLFDAGFFLASPLVKLLLALPTPILQTKVNVRIKIFLLGGGIPPLL